VVEETGIGIDFRVRSSLALAFTEADVQRLQSALPWQQRCGSGFWGGQRPSLAPYVTLTWAKDGATASRGRSGCLRSLRSTSCHGDGVQGRGHRLRRVFTLPKLFGLQFGILIPSKSLAKADGRGRIPESMHPAVAVSHC